MAGVFEVLGKDHAEVKQMLARLEAGPAASSGASGSDLAQRRKMVQRLVIEESRHEAMEEIYFWPAVRDKVADGDKLAATAIEQEQEGKEVLDKLDKLDASEPEFERLVTTFIRAAASTSPTRRRGSGQRCAPRSPQRNPASLAPRSSRARRPPRPARIRIPRPRQQS